MAKLTLRQQTQDRVHWRLRRAGVNDTQCPGRSSTVESGQLAEQHFYQTAELSAKKTGSIPMAGMRDGMATQRWVLMGLQAMLLVARAAADYDTVGKHVNDPVSGASELIPDGLKQAPRCSASGA